MIAARDSAPRTIKMLCRLVFTVARSAAAYRLLAITLDDRIALVLGRAAVEIVDVLWFADHLFSDKFTNLKSWRAVSRSPFRSI